MLAGCGGSDDPVEVDRHRVAGDARETCPALLDALPEQVSDQPKRRTTGNDLAAAYGDPPIVVRCGVGEPEGFDRFATCNRANGIDWFVADLEDVVEDQSRDVTMTTIGRDPALRVNLPADYRPPATAMVDLTKAIKAHTEKVGGCV